jgi:hypothetical protein
MGEYMRRAIAHGGESQGNMIGDYRPRALIEVSEKQPAAAWVVNLGRLRAYGGRKGRLY